MIQLTVSKQRRPSTVHVLRLSILVHLSRYPLGVCSGYCSHPRQPKCKRDQLGNNGQIGILTVGLSFFFFFLFLLETSIAICDRHKASKLCRVNFARPPMPDAFPQHDCFASAPPSFDRLQVYSSSKYPSNSELTTRRLIPNDATSNQL